ncbi:hypothetical protein [Variovorax soli]|uniref:hypothetical protein n=1 Tax=Variovorax soli TaxID=376815 RepID=UPI000838D476|nr:hypothetical protein [Variovorax soli]
MMIHYNAERMLGAATVTKGRIRREGEFLRVTCPNGYELNVAGHRPDIAAHLAGGGPMSWPPRPGDPTIGPSPAARTDKRAVPRKGFTLREVEMLGDMLKPVLRPLLEAHAKATRGPAKAPMTKAQAMARIAGIQAAVAVAEARAAAALRMAT